MKVLCQIAPQGRFSKPETLQEYGKLRDSMIQSPWVYLEEEDFIRKVTSQGHPFYGCLFKGHDLQELQYQKLCWYTQTIVGVDFDKCEVSPGSMVEKYSTSGYTPWLVYRTFSDGTVVGRHSYRLLWKVSVNLNVSYEAAHSFIKRLAALSGGNLADKHSMDPSRLWQGTRSGYVWYNPGSLELEIT